MRNDVIDLELIDEPDAPVRADIDEIEVHELAESIKEVGLINPIMVRRRGERFEVIAGHRRLLAHRELGLSVIRCTVLEEQSDDDTMAQRLHENIFRRDLTPIEEAVVYAELFERVQDVEKISRIVRRSRQVVESRLLLLSGDEEVRNMLHAGMISLGVAEELNRVKSQATRRFLLRFAVAEGATVSKVTGWRQQYANVDLAPGQEPERPSEPGPAVPEMSPANVCWLCGTNEEPWDMRVRMVHETCEKVARSAAAERIERARAIAGAPASVDAAGDAESVERV